MEMKLQGMLRLATVVVVACAAAGGAASEIDTRFTVHDLSRQQAKTLAASSAPARAPARAAAT